MNSYDNYFLPIDNMEEAKDFYGNKLGLNLKFDFSDKGMSAFNVGSEAPSIISRNINKFPDVKPTIWFVVDNVMKTYNDLKGNGVKFLSTPFRIRTGNAAEFEDPFGNRLGITDYN